jgi:hypothetical protein
MFLIHISVITRNTNSRVWFCNILGPPTWISKVLLLWINYNITCTYFEMLLLVVHSLFSQTLALLLKSFHFVFNTSVFVLPGWLRLKSHRILRWYLLDIHYVSLPLNHHQVYNVQGAFSDFLWPIRMSTTIRFSKVCGTKNVTAKYIQLMLKSTWSIGMPLISM